MLSNGPGGYLGVTIRIMLRQLCHQGMVAKQSKYGLVAQVHPRFLRRIKCWTCSLVNVIPKPIKIYKKMNIIRTNRSSMPNISERHLQVFDFTWDVMTLALCRFKIPTWLNVRWHSGHATSWARRVSGVSMGRIKSLGHRSGTTAQTSDTMVATNIRSLRFCKACLILACCSWRRIHGGVSWSRSKRF